jgi:dephospho-CoA kinase
MSQSKLVGVTGGIGSGKSLVCRIFLVLGVPVFNADAEARMIAESEPEVMDAIRKRFGDDVYQDNRLQRKKLAEKVFGQPSELEALNAIIHPAVRGQFSKWVAGHATHSYLIKEAAIMFESGTYKEMDFLVHVSAPVEMRIDRVMLRDGMSREEVMQRIGNQWPDKERERLSDHIIRNDDTELIIPQIIRLHGLFQSRA